MTTEPNTGPLDSPTEDFESALRTLVLESFAEGATVQGTWELSTASSAVPNWQITIEKVDDADLPEGTTSFLDQ